MTTSKRQKGRVLPAHDEKELRGRVESESPVRWVVGREDRRKARQAVGFTEEELAEFLDVPVEAIVDWEANLSSAEYPLTEPYRKYLAAFQAGDLYRVEFERAA